MQFTMLYKSAQKRNNMRLLQRQLAFLKFYVFKPSSKKIILHGIFIAQQIVCLTIFLLS